MPFSGFSKTGKTGNFNILFFLVSFGPFLFFCAIYFYFRLLNPIQLHIGGKISENFFGRHPLKKAIGIIN